MERQTAAATEKARRDGLPLCDAARSFVGGELWRKFEAAQQALVDHRKRPEDAERRLRRHDEWRILRRDDKTHWSEGRRASPHVQEGKRLEVASLEARQAVIAELWRMLADGRLAATGRHGGPTAETGKIPASAWRHLKVKDLDQSILVEQTQEKRRLFDVRIRDIQKPTAAAEVSCRKWLSAEMRRNPQQQPRTKAEYQREALRRDSGLSKRGFDRAWRAAIKETRAEWGKAGRPRSAGNRNGAAE